MEPIVPYKNMEHLEIAKYHRSARDADVYTKRVFKLWRKKLREHHGPNIEPFGGGEAAKKAIREGIQSARISGVPENIQRAFEHYEPTFFHVLRMGAQTDVSGVNLKMNYKMDRYDVKVEQPFLFGASVDFFADDILYYRAKAVESVNEFEFESAARNYRSYLNACLSLMEAFISRNIEVLEKYMPRENWDEKSEIVSSRKPIADRIDAWFGLVSDEELQKVKSGKYWSQFDELRQERNRYVHPSEQVIAFAPLKKIKYLNYCRDGIGGLLGKMRTSFGDHPNLGFIQRVKTAPLISKKAR